MRIPQQIPGAERDVASSAAPAAGVAAANVCDNILMRNTVFCRS